MQLKFNRGTTLVELMVAITVLAILIGLGMPSFSTWMANSRVRSTVEAFQNGLRYAKIEAIRRNTTVDFVMLPSTIVANGTAALGAGSPSNTGTGWVVRLGGSNGVGANFLQGAQGGEHGAITITSSPVAFTGVVSFDGMGRMTAPVIASPATDLQIGFDAAGADRPLRVSVRPGGQIRMCDPAYPAGDTQGC